MADLERLEEDRRVKRAVAVLENWARRRKSIILLIDNLDLVLDRLSSSLWALRETLSHDNRLVVVGASSQFIEDAIDYRSPFYEFFHVHELGPLSESDARHVVLSLARQANTSRVTDVLEQDPGRFKALYVFTGGTPRTLALLHTVLDHSGRIERDLEGLLDQLTPYYKARFDDLPPQSQVVVDKVALHWHPITAAQCQTATQLEINAVSAQLHRLVKNGVLTKVSLPGETKLGFQVSERFFNIWYLMRASRRQRRRLLRFVEFLRICFGEEDIRRRAEEMIRTAPLDSLNSAAKVLAFASAVSDEALRRRLELRAVEMLVAEDAVVVRQSIDLHGLHGDDVHLASVVDRVRVLREIRERITAAEIRWPKGYTASSVAELVAGDVIASLAYKRAASLLIQSGRIDPVRSFPWSSAQARSALGDRLQAAISSGEVPSLGDVATPAEVRQVVALVDAKPLAISSLLLATEPVAPLSDAAVKELLRSNRSGAEELILATTVLVKRCMLQPASELPGSAEQPRSPGARKRSAATVKPAASGRPRTRRGS